MNLLRKALQTYAPQSLGELTYQAAVRTFKAAAELNLKDTHAQIWTSNDYQLGEWTPFASNVDFTIWFAKEPSQRDLKSIKKNYERVRKVFPIMGQLTLYVATDFDLISGLSNSFELERDPLLKKKITSRSELDARANAAAFLFRMLERDIKGVLHSPEKLAAKWDSYLLSAGKVLSDDVFESWQHLPESNLLKLILKLAVLILDVPQADQVEVMDALELYFQSVGRDVPVDKLRPLVEKDSYLWAVFPHRYCYHSVEPPKLTGKLIDLAMAQVSWELYGMLAQSRLQTSDELVRASTRSHLDLLEEFYHRFLSSKGQISATADQRINKAVKRIRTLV